MYKHWHFPATDFHCWTNAFWFGTSSVVIDAGSFLEEGEHSPIQGLDYFYIEPESSGIIGENCKVCHLVQWGGKAQLE